MKKTITFAILSVISLIFVACGMQDDKQGKDAYIGYWQNDENTIFEVLSENGTDFIIRNVYGDLTAKIENGALRGKNSVDMDFSMKVKGDSAFYLFADITTNYKRITKEEYDKISSTLAKQPVPQQPAQ